jgi:hypothetical protein
MTLQEMDDMVLQESPDSSGGLSAVASGIGVSREERGVVPLSKMCSVVQNEAGNGTAHKVSLSSAKILTFLCMPA